jgi:hypothetical protein
MFDLTPNALSHVLKYIEFDDFMFWKERLKWPSYNAFFKAHQIKPIKLRGKVRLVFPDKNCYSYSGRYYKTFTLTLEDLDKARYFRLLGYLARQFYSYNDPLCLDSYSELCKKTLMGKFPVYITVHRPIDRRRFSTYPRSSISECIDAGDYYGAVYLIRCGVKPSFDDIERCQDEKLKNMLIDRW